MSKETIFSPEWLAHMDQAVRNCKHEDGSPEIVTGCYAAKKTKVGWRISNGRAWWDKPTLVRELHEYPDGTVCAHNYIEGVGTYPRRTIENNGLQPIRPQNLPSILPISKIVYFDHRDLTADGRAKRMEYKMEGSR